MQYDLKMLTHFRVFNAQWSTNYPDLNVLYKLEKINFNVAQSVIISPHSKEEIREAWYASHDFVHIGHGNWRGSYDEALDLESFNHKTLQEITKNQNRLIFVDALEYLQEIRPILSFARKFLLEGGKEVVVTGREYSENSKSFGFRRWRLDRLADLFEASGFEVVEKGSELGYYKLSIACNKSGYGAFLRSLNLPDYEIKHLLITTEHSSYRVTGGIGSYVSECEHLYKERAGILILDSNKDIDLETVAVHRWLASQIFLDEEYIEEISHANYDTLGDVVYETIKSVLLFYELDSIESQEMCLYTTIIAKEAGIIPNDIRLITACHGSSFHLAKAKRDVLELENIHVAYREKFTIEHSDNVILPTEFLRSSYEDSGVLGMRENTKVVKRLPFNHARLPVGAELVTYKNLIYIGKMSTVKGFDLFLGTLLELYNSYPNVASSIESVSIFATSVDIKEKYLQEMYDEVKKLYNTTTHSLNREDLLEKLSQTSRDSLALVTYRGDNHAMVILELLGIGHDFLAAKAGGTPELIPAGFEDIFLVEPRERELAKAIKRACITMPKRASAITKARQEYLTEQQKINQSYSLDSLYKLPKKQRTSPTWDFSPEVVVQVIETGNKQDLSNTLKSLEQQGVSMDISISKHSSEKIAGTSGFIRLYAGDLLRPFALKKMRSLLYSSEQISVVTAREMVQAYENNKSLGMTHFIPYPPELGSVFLQEKYSRRIVALFKNGEDLLGPEFDDWYQCVHLAAKQREMRNYPETLIDLESSFRLNEDLLQKFSKTSHVLSSLSIFDAYIINYQIKRLDDMYFGTRLFNHLEDIYIRKDHESITYDLSPEMKRFALLYEHKAPHGIKSAFRFTSKRGYRLVKSVKKAISRS